METDRIRWEDLDDEELLDVVDLLMKRHPDSPPMRRLRTAIATGSDAIRPRPSIG